MCEKLQVSGGISIKDSITIFGKTEIYARATRERNGKITIERNCLEGTQNSEKLLKWMVFSLGICREALIHMEAPGWSYHIPTIILSISLLLPLAYVYLAKAKWLMYHGAEHKVIGWYEKNETIPTIEEVQKVSRINPNGGTNLVVAVIIFQLLSSICMICFNVHIAEIITVIAPFYVSHRFPFSFIGGMVQYLTTKEPKEEHLEVAIAALENLLKADKS